MQKCLKPVFLRFTVYRSFASRGETRARKNPDTQNKLIPISLKVCELGMQVIYIFVFLAYILEINNDTRNIHLLFLNLVNPNLYDFLVCVTNTKHSSSGSTVQYATFDVWSCGMLLVLSGWP
jgi:hypothetical protein